MELKFDLMSLPPSRGNGNESSLLPVPCSDFHVNRFFRHVLTITVKTIRSEQIWHGLDKRKPQSGTERYSLRFFQVKVVEHKGLEPLAFTLPV